MVEHEKWQLEKYGQELDAIAEALTLLHPIGEVKAIGRLESVAAFMQWLESINGGENREKCRKAIGLLRERHSELQASSR